jgi:prepilin-type N-terminal cleavage/methylation domain-containing protein
MKKQKGFTIIELVVVVAIIATLSAVVMTNVMKYIKSSKIARFKADAHQVQIAAIKYFADNGSYPLSTTGQEIESAPSPFPDFNYNASYLGPNYYYVWWDGSGSNDGGCYYFIISKPDWSSFMQKNIICTSCSYACNDSSYTL